MDSLTQQQESSATLSDMDAPDGSLVTSTVLAVGKFGWKTFIVVAGKQTSHGVAIVAGAGRTANTVTMFLSRVSPTRLQQLLWLEEEIRGLDALKCFMLIIGELFVMMDSLMQQQELSATLLSLIHI